LPLPEAAVRVFGGRCAHYLFCSTVCTYGVLSPPEVLISEDFAQRPTSGYGRGKTECEAVFRRAHAAGAFAATIIRPSCTYGPGGTLIDQLEFNPPTWDRIEKGLPVLCADGGLGLWQATHRDDVGRLFAHAALEPRTFGQDYNAVRDEVFTWRDYYRQAGEALGRDVRLISVPAAWLIASVDSGTPSKGNVQRASSASVIAAGRAIHRAGRVWGGGVSGGKNVQNTNPVKTIEKCFHCHCTSGIRFCASAASSGRQKFFCNH
jgi:nucleoside-diphosphate-sugar epimerase